MQELTTEVIITDPQMELIKKTIAPDATADELQLFIYDCKRQGVHPLDKMIHFTKRKSTKDGRDVWKYTPITSIDFMRARAIETGECAGNDDPVFSGATKSDEFKATVTVYRLVQGIKCSFSATARWIEYIPSGNQAFMWNKMPCVMLGKTAEALALRKAFPRELKGLYSAEEMDQAVSESKVAENGTQGAKLPIPVGVKAGIQDERDKSDPFLLNMSNKLPDWIGKKVFDLILLASPGDGILQSKLLEELSAFDGEDGKVKGKRKINELSDLRLKTIYGKLQKHFPNASFQLKMNEYETKLGDKAFYTALGAEGIEDYKALINPADQAKIIKLLEAVVKEKEEKDQAKEIFS